MSTYEENTRNALTRIGQVTRDLGIHPDTIRNHEKRGTIHPFRNRAGVRFLTCEDIEKLRDCFTPKRD